MSPINSLSFWEELYSEYMRQNRSSCFLCKISPAFHLAWSHLATRNQLYELAMQFYEVEGNKIATVILTEWENDICDVLFNATSSADDRLLRQAFIQWNINRLQATLCKHCKQQPAESPHICPYQEDINGDSTTLCTCCDKCQQNCIADI